MLFNRLRLWLAVFKIKGIAKICAFILGASFLSVLILHVSADSTKRPDDSKQPKSPAELLREKKTRSKEQRAPIAQPEQDDTKVVSSGVGVPQTVVVRPEVSSGPVYSKIPELTPAQANALKRDSEEEEPSVRVPQGRVWTEIPKPADPSTAPVLGEGGLQQMSGSISPQAASDFRYQQTTDLSLGSASFSEIHEPSVASMGSTVFYTGNWYAARSTNGGQSFSFVSPFTTFPSVNGGFCCDQVANYVPSQDMMLWEMQYFSDGNSNTIRIARAVGSTAVANNSWISYKFTPQDFGFPTGTYLDFPGLTFSSTFLYLTENVFTSGGSDQDSQGTFTGAVIVRIRLSDLAAGGSISTSYYAQNHSSSDVGSLRCTEGAGATMYCAGFKTTSQLRIFHWDDGASTIPFDDVNTAAFTSLTKGSGIATSPDGTNFASRADGRILGAWVANNVIGFMWAAKQDSTFPYPYVVIERFDQNTRARISHNALWSSTSAWLYPTASPNSAGNLAGLVAFGGGSNYPGANIWINDDVESGFSPLGLHSAASGTAGPASNKWGDYLTVRPHKDSPNTWVGAAYSLRGGSSGSNAVPRYLWFGRERDFGTSPPPTPTPTPTPPPTPPNLTPYQPSGWSDKIVVSKVTGTNTDSTPLTTSDTLYIDWAVINNGTGATAVDFFTKLYVDGVEKASWVSNPPLNSNFYAFVSDYSLGSLSAGSHTLKIVTDTSGVITESNEADNEYSRVITISSAAAPPTVRLTSTNFPVTENIAAGYVTVGVIREGDATSAASVDFATSDTAGLTACSTGGTGKASERCDYATSLGTLSWAAGEAGTKTFNIPIINDALVEGTETFNVTISNPIGVSVGTTTTATVTITDNDSNPPGPNPIDGVDFFITEQYIDFLGRMPDAGGFANWHNTLAPCPNGGFGEPPTSNCDRLHVAAGFFQSDEFLNRGYWAFRLYMVSYNQRPTYAQFIPDMAQVGGPKSPAEEEASKVAFSNAFVLQSAFVSKYPGLSGQPLANALWTTAGLTGTPITAGAMTKGQILRAIAETSTAFNKFLTDGTVAIQYFAFLRRDPDSIGYQNNITTLKNDPNNLRHMIFIFIYSSEYRGRFGAP
ncbi:MAG: hypothetical protein QOH42_2277 [Blastocatellia bacterium]|nr:hypothetical protein [Blastocatellia bacterium]